MRKILSKTVTGALLVPEISTHIKSIHPIYAYKNFSMPSVVYLDTSTLNCLHSILPKEVRMFNKNTLLAIECLNELDFNGQLLKQKRERVGIYVAGPWNILNVEVLNAAKNLSPYDSMKNYFNPKYNLKNMLSHLPGHISIYFGTNGPTNCFQDIDCGLHAIQAACWDLKSGFIDLAVVICLNTYGELITAAEHALDHNDDVLYEGACAILLNSEDVEKLNVLPMKKNLISNMGYLTPLLHLWEI